MGMCEGPNARIEEVEILGSSIHQIDPFLYQVCPSICKIIFSNKVGTGFFIKLLYLLFFHIILLISFKNINI